MSSALSEPNTVETALPKKLWSLYYGRDQSFSKCVSTDMIPHKTRYPDQIGGLGSRFQQGSWLDHKRSYDDRTIIANLFSIFVSCTEIFHKDAGISKASCHESVK